MQQAFAANCNTQRMSVNFCKRCTTVIPVSTSRDTACTGSPPNTQGRTASEANLVVPEPAEKRPQHGTVSTSGQS